MKLNAAWAGIIVTVALALGSALMNIQGSLSYNNAMSEIQLKKTDLAMEKQKVLEERVRLKEKRLNEHNVRITIAEHDIVNLHQIADTEVPRIRELEGTMKEVQHEIRRSPALKEGRH